MVIDGASPYPGREPSSSEEIAAPSVGERIRTQLEVHDQRAGQGLAGRAGTRRVDALDVHRRSVARGHPQSSALPAGLRIVDAAVHALGEEAHGIRNAQLDDLPVRQRVERIREIAGADRRVRAQAQDVVLIDPGVIRPLGGALPAGERGARDRIEGTVFGTEVPLRRARAIEEALASSPVDTLW